MRGGFPGGRGTDSSFVLLVNWIRWEFISSDEEFVPSDRKSAQLCVHGPYSIISIACINKPLPHQSPALGPTLYKFIVMGPLGPDPVHPWA